ncbi:MAG: TIGR02444 family protein [Gammaproteobacteria bacterium]|jgi:uncharacterized protein (TIGR02444 family)|nr:TIGR02444 family protein [Gammaproteobacteria bacterium]
MSAEFPEHPFWPFSLQLYAQPGVSAACLELQDDYGLDVNLVLFCIWSGLHGPGELQADELSESIARAASWQTEVVQRIRYVRRTLKHDALGATTELAAVLRPRVQAVEIDAEHVEQLLLAAVVPLQRGPRDAAAAQTNLRRYLQSAGLDPQGGVKSAAGRVLAAALQLMA